MSKNTALLSVRIDEELNYKLDDMANKAGVSKSEMARILLSDLSTIRFIDGSRIATELFKIRQLLEKDDFDDVIKHEVFLACKNFKLEIKKVFEEGGEFRGHSESN